jgi:protein O-mannosyl-transferase
MLGLALVLAAVLLYTASIRGDFVYLDHLEITNNPIVSNINLALQGFTHPATNIVLAGRGYYYRPLYFLALATIYRLVGSQPWAFHLFQIALFGATSYLVFLMALEFFSSVWVAFFGALLWLVHPAHVEAVAWISSLCDVGCAFFLVLALLLFVRAEKQARPRFMPHVVAAFTFFGALLLKEMAFALPLLLLAYWFFVAPPESWKARAARFSPYVCVFVVYVALRREALGRLTAGGDAIAISSSLLARSITLLGAHTRIFLWPSHLTLARTIGLFSNSYLPWPVVLVVALSFAFAVRKRWPLLTFLISCWPLALIPVLDVRQLTPPYLADRFSYLPSIFLCLGLSYALIGLLTRTGRATSFRRLPALAASVLIVVWAVVTIRNIPHWSDNGTLARYSIAESPEFPPFHCLLGESLFNSHGDLYAAASEYEMTLQFSALHRDLWRSAANCGHMGLAAIAADRDHLAEAARQYQLAAIEMPANGNAYRALASLYIRQKDYEPALEPLRDLVALNPSDLQDRFNLGVCLLRLSRYSEALDQFQVVDLADPNFPNILEAKQQARDQSATIVREPKSPP